MVHKYVIPFQQERWAGSGIYRDTQYYPANPDNPDTSSEDWGWERRARCAVAELLLSLDEDAPAARL